MESIKIDDSTREIRISIQELQDALEIADVIDGVETINEVRIEPRELIVTVVK